MSVECEKNILLQVFLRKEACSTIYVWTIGMGATILTVDRWYQTSAECRNVRRLISKKNNCFVERIFSYCDVAKRKGNIILCHKVATFALKID